MRINVNQTQCGFVMKNGCYEKMIFAGTYHYPACMGYKVIIEEMRGRVGFKEVPLKVLKEDAAFMSRVTMVEVPEGQLGILYINHAASAVVTDREAAYWNVWEPCELRFIDMREPVMDRNVEKNLLRLIAQLKDRMGASVILITHDLGVVAEIANDVMVMYAGEAVEYGGVHELFKNPLHPYTEGLLRSVPVMGRRVDALYNIPGTVPSPKDYPAGCRFSPRCAHSADRCRTERPPLYEMPDGRRARCFLCEEGGKRLD